MTDVSVNEKRNRGIGGVVLIVLGTLLLVAQFVDLGNVGILVPFALGGIFMIWGIATRNDGLMIPGGVLLGVGAGIYAIAGPGVDWFGLEAANEGAVFMAFFGLGWVSITLFSAIFGKETHWWALIPATVFFLVAAAVGMGGFFMTALEFLGKAWPVFLILAGIGVLVRQLRQRDAEETLVEKSLKEG